MNWCYKYLVTVVTLPITLLTKPHDPLSTTLDAAGGSSNTSV